MNSPSRARLAGSIGFSTCGPVTGLQVLDDDELHLPSIEALTSTDESLLSEELRRVATRRQIALVRTIADALDQSLSRSTTPGRVAAMRAQLVEEVARLGCRALEAADAMVADDQSGVYRIP